MGRLFRLLTRFRWREGEKEMKVEVVLVAVVEEEEEEKKEEEEKNEEEEEWKGEDESRDFLGDFEL